jgi:VCBS repeat-containing protein
MPAGTDAFIETAHRAAANFKLNTPILLPINVFDVKLKHVTGSGDFIIRKDGLYKYSAEFETQEPTQLTIFVNGIANTTTVFGTDSGASQGVINNILKLCKGDCVQIRNAWSVGSSDNSINLDVNPGGTYAANNISVSFTRIAP